MDRLLSTFRQSFHSEPEIVVRTPGRVNLIGEHTDYNDGFVLPIAIDREVTIAASACASHLATITSIDFDQAAAFRITELLPRSELGWVAYPTSQSDDPSALPSVAGQAPSTSMDIFGWAVYPAGVAWSLRDAGLELSGLDAVFTSNVPIGAGLSSSAAVEVGFATAWERLSGLTLRRTDMARLCQRAENEYVGVKCGIMDQMISAMGKAGHALLIDCRDLSRRHVPLPDGYSVVVGDTKVERSLASSAYNERRGQCEEAVRILRAHDTSIRALRDVTPDFLEKHADELPEVVRRRARHVVGENARTLESVNALKRGDLLAFGQAMIASQASLRDDYEVSCHELDEMVEAALRVEGVIGARMTGGGFGGCTVSLVRNDAVERYLNEVPKAYRQATGIEPAVYVCTAADGATIVKG
jgi:galactokinase